MGNTIIDMQYVWKCVTGLHWTVSFVAAHRVDSLGNIKALPEIACNVLVTKKGVTKK